MTTVHYFTLSLYCFTLSGFHGVMLSMLIWNVGMVKMFFWPRCWWKLKNNKQLPLLGSPINVIKNAHTHTNEWTNYYPMLGVFFCNAVVVPLALEGLMGGQYVLTNGMDGMPAFSGVCVCLWVMKRESITKWMPLTGGLLGNLDYPAA